MHADYAVTLNNLAYLYVVERRFDEAEPLLRESLRINRSRCGSNHIYVANALESLGWLMMLEEKYVEAEEFLIEAVKIAENIYGSSHPDLAYYLVSLADVYGRAAQVDKMSKVIQRASGIYDAFYGTGHPAAARCSRVFSVCLRKQGKLNSAFGEVKCGYFGPSHTLPAQQRGALGI